MRLEMIVQQSFHAAIDMDLSIKDWSIRAKLHPSTIYKLARGKTRYPRFQTIESLARAVGLKLHAEK